MTLLIGVVFILIVAGVVAGLVSGKIAGGLDDPTSTIPARGFAVGPIAAEAVRELRFVPALRGYRMVQVDEALDRLADELTARDAEIARLRESLAGFGVDVALPAESAVEPDAVEPTETETDAATETVSEPADVPSTEAPVAEPEVAEVEVAAAEPQVDAKSDEADAKSDEADAKSDEADAKSDEADAKSDEADALPPPN